MVAQGRKASFPVGVNQGKLPGRGAFVVGLKEWKGFSSGNGRESRRGGWKDWHRGVGATWGWQSCR